jgi:hypothetical protein
MAEGIKNMKQHFVPQCYLRGFSNNGKGIFTYNKSLEKSFQIGIKDACQIDDFYKIHRKFVDEKEREQFEENFYEMTFFAKHIEIEYNKQLSLVKHLLSEWINNPHDRPALDNITRDLLAGYLGIQVLRLPHIRNDYYQAYKKAEQKRFEIIKGFVAGNNLDYKDFIDMISLNQDDDYASIVHSEIYANQALIDGMQDRLREKTWAFLVSETNDLYTSDFPLVVVPFVPDQAPYYNGVGMRGVQIVIPITGNLAISMWDPDLFDHANYQAEKFQLISSLDKMLFNLYQYANADTNVFCASNSFEFINNVKQDGMLSSVYVYKSKTEVH